MAAMDPRPLLLNDDRAVSIQMRDRSPSAVEPLNERYMNFSDEEYEKVAFPPLFVRPKLWMITAFVVFALSTTLCLTVGKHAGVSRTSACDAYISSHNETCADPPNNRTLFNNCTRFMDTCELLEAFPGNCSEYMVLDACDQGTCLPGMLNVGRRELIELISIPLVSVAFTYVHIWLALWMTFYPIRFFGCLQIPGTNTGLGWQGIIPFKAEKMARKSVQLMTTQLLDIREIFGRLDPERMAREMEPKLRLVITDMIDRLATMHAPDVWAKMPAHLKQNIVDKACEDSPTMITAMMNEIKDKIDTVFDLEDMVVTLLLRDKELLCEIFIRCGYNELAFIRNSGATMGLLFGVLQMLVYIWYPCNWVLPAVGLLVGSATNWLALKMIFSPINPVRCGCCILHGLFLKRQAEVSAVYGRIITQRVMTAKNILTAFISGPSTDKLFAVVRTSMSRAVDSFQALPQSFINLAIGAQQYDAIKRSMVEEMVAILPDTLREVERYTDETLNIEETLREKMAGLPSKEFESLLHPVFEEDEWKLILMGGVLGVVVGLVQFYVFPDQCNHGFSR